MVDYETMEQALNEIGDLTQNGPDCGDWLREQGIDPDATFQTAADHADAANYFGIPASVSFGAGFVLAVYLCRVTMQKENNG
jgi:hypothetical protein